MIDETYEERLHMFRLNHEALEKIIDELQKPIDEFVEHNSYGDGIKFMVVNREPDTIGEIIIRGMLLTRLL